MTLKPATRVHATSSLFASLSPHPGRLKGADRPLEEALTGHGWRRWSARLAAGCARPVMAVLPLLVVALWHSAGMAQPQPQSRSQSQAPTRAPAPTTSTPLEASRIVELQVLQSQQAVTLLRRLKSENGTVELWLHPSTNQHYIVVSSPQGDIRRVAKAGDERSALLSFESFKRQVSGGEAAPAMAPAMAPPTEAMGAAGGQAAVSVTGGPVGAVMAARTPPSPTPTVAVAAPTPAPAAAVPDVPATPAKPVVTALIAEVQRLESAGVLNALRRTENGSYNAAVLFHAETARYFVTLSQGEQLWRVISTTDGAQALRSYDELSRQSSALSADEIRRLELKAQTEAAVRELEAARAQARQLSEELEADRRYRAMIQSQEAQSRLGAAELRQQRQQLQEQLVAEQMRVRELRRQLDPAAEPALAGGAGAAGAAVSARRTSPTECRIARPGQAVPPSERDLPLCGADGRARTQ